MLPICLLLSLMILNRFKRYLLRHNCSIGIFGSLLKLGLNLDVVSVKLQVLLRKLTLSYWVCGGLSWLECLQLHWWLLMALEILYLLLRILIILVTLCLLFIVTVYQLGRNLEIRALEGWTLSCWRLQVILLVVNLVQLIFLHRIFWHPEDLRLNGSLLVSLVVNRMMRRRCLGLVIKALS